MVFVAGVNDFQRPAVWRVRVELERLEGVNPKRAKVFKSLFRATDPQSTGKEEITSMHECFNCSTMV